MWYHGDLVRALYLARRPDSDLRRAARRSAAIRERWVAGWVRPMAVR